MTKSLRASARKKHTPCLRDLVSEAEIERYHAEKQAEFLALGAGDMAPMAAGQAAALKFSTAAFFEAAFERIAKLESELRKAKSLTTKSLDTRFSLDDLAVEQIDDRHVRLVLQRGDDEASFDLKFPVMIDRGVWSDRAVYERGDAVSFGGSLWIAQRDDPAKPDTPESGWRLSVKRGQPGKDARP